MGSTYSIVFFLTVVVVILFKLATKRKSKPKLPPGPWQLPILGSLHHLLVGSNLPHRRFKQLSDVHGPLIHLKLGEISTVVASSPDAAREILKTHDITFATRPLFPAVNILSYDGKSLSFGPYGECWRQMRKIAVLELLSARRVHSFRRIREEAACNLISSISSSCSMHGGGCVVNLSKMTVEMANNVTMRTTIRSKPEDQERLIELMYEGIELTTGFDLMDLFPSMSWLVNLFSVSRSKVERCHKKMDETLERVIEEHREKRRRSSSSSSSYSSNIEEVVVEDLADVLLRLKEEGDLQVELTNDHIKALLSDMFAGGSETTSSTLQWAMSELMRNPTVMRKAQTEIRDALKGKAEVAESDIKELNYLHLVIKETLRLHPPLPLLLPRECQEKCKLLGYDIPAKSRVMVNAWAIGRDPKYWEDAEEFRPERFEGSAIDFKGANFELLSFGAGRRMCPGMLFGLATVELPLALLLHHFDWELPASDDNSITSPSLDMSEAFGLSAHRKLDLFLRATSRV